MKIPFLIFLVSGFATLRLEPLATRGADVTAKYIQSQKIVCLKEDLAYVQMDLMKVLETDRAVTARLQSREAGLKYALRAEQVRQDEVAQCQNPGGSTSPLIPAPATAVSEAIPGKTIVGATTPGPCGG